jgi:hypothetical protein
MIALEDKGQKDGRCNRTACGSEEGVTYFNNSTRMFYCRKCAFQIQKWATLDHNIWLFDDLKKERTK